MFTNTKERGDIRRGGGGGGQSTIIAMAMRVLYGTKMAVRCETFNDASIYLGGGGGGGGRSDISCCCSLTWQ